MSRLEFLGAAAGAALGVFGGSACKTGESPPPTRVKGTVPTTTTTLPDTAVPTTNSTTEAPTTTQAERTFASPEQQAQVEAVEANMVRFFELTPEQVDQYKEQVPFHPSGSGFSTLATYQDYYSTMAVNLGVFYTPTGDGRSGLGVFGVVRSDGSRLAFICGIEVDDSEFKERFSGGNDRGATVILKDAKGEFQTQLSIDAKLVDGMIEGTRNLITHLHKPNHTGTPVMVEYGTDGSWIERLGEYSFTPNQTLLQTHDLLNHPSGIKALNERFSQEELESVGIFTQSSQIPQNLLDGSHLGTVPQLFENLPSIATFRFFKDVPPITSR